MILPADDLCLTGVTDTAPWSIWSCLLAPIVDHCGAGLDMYSTDPAGSVLHGLCWICTRQILIDMS